MTNPWAGEVALTLDGKEETLRLTLGALAGLEDDLQAGSLAALIDRFEDGQFSAQDISKLLYFGLKGAGWKGSKRDLEAAAIDGGVLEATRVAARLLAISFSFPGAAEDVQD